MLLDLAAAPAQERVDFGFLASSCFFFYIFPDLFWKFVGCRSARGRGFRLTMGRVALRTLSPAKIAGLVLCFLGLSAMVVLRPLRAHVSSGGDRGYCYIFLITIVTDFGVTDGRCLALIKSSLSTMAILQKQRRRLKAVPWISFSYSTLIGEMISLMITRCFDLLTSPP